MTNKYILVVGLVVVIAAVGLVNFGNSALSPGKYIIENFSGNFYDSGDNSVSVENDENLGAIEFNTGKVVYDNLASNVLQKRTVTVSAAQVDTLQNVPVVLIPSVGGDKVTIVDSIIGFRRFSSESWSRNDVESFEVKWGMSNTASAAAGVTGMAGSVTLGASFSDGFLTGGSLNTIASPSVQLWKPSARTPGGASAGTASISFDPIQYASSSGVYLTGLVNPDNTETSGITDFVFEVIYRVLSRP